VKFIPRALAYARPYWKLTIASIALIFLGSAASLLVPWPLQILIDNVFDDKPLPPILSELLGPVGQNQYALLIFAVVAGLLITLLVNGQTVFENYVNSKLEQHMILDFRSDLFQHAQRLSMTYHDEISSGRLMKALTFEAETVGQIAAMMPQLAQNLITLVAMVWIIMQIDPVLAALSLTVIPFLTIAITHYTRRIEPHILRVKGMEADSMSITHEAMALIRIVVAYSRESYEHARFRRQSVETIRQRIWLTVRQTLYSLSIEGTTAFGRALILGFGGYRVLQGDLTVGSLLVVMSYVEAIYSPLQAISGTAGYLVEAIAGLKMGLHMLDTDPEVKEAPDAAEIGRAHGDIRFDHVDFNYRGRTETLVDISFEAGAGQVIGIVGLTGAGKSTLVSLIPRFYDPSGGQICIDDIDIRTLTLQSLRAQIALVLQEPLLFSGSIIDNIRYGNLEASDADVVEAAKAANAHDFIVRLPEGYETHLGERGPQLSGGERQRIAVARAFIKDAPILILDEPTSAIDSKTEAVILDALERLMEGRTTVMIAHRLSTIRNADIILVLDQGRLVQRGGHEELVNQEGLYRQLYEMQTLRSSSAAAVADTTESTVLAELRT
jgi:ATP-binding cassette, subfamily B, bacterial